jgi:hypothetical protein
MAAAPDDSGRLSFSLGRSEYLRLMYIDIMEFDDRHSAETFHDLPEQ